jgi:cytochrome c2
MIPVRQVLAVLALGACLTAGAVDLRTTPVSDDDLRVSGLFLATPDNATRYVSRAALLTLPGVTHLNEMPAESIPAADLTVLPIDRLLDALPLAPGADGIALICSDRWQTFMPVGLVRKVHPYLMLEYAGRTPAQGWPRFGPLEGLAPYYCNWSLALGPKPDPRIEYGEFDATQIIEIRAVNTRERYAPFYAGPLAALSAEASEGRKIFIRECNMCHQGPAGVGGNTSQRPFAVLQIHATLNTAYFKAMVRNPKQFYPQTVMPLHGYFTDAMMAQLIAFLSEARSANVN